MDSQDYSMNQLLGVSSDGEDLLSLALHIEEGLPVEAIDHLVAIVAPGNISLKYRFLPKPTLARRKKSAKKILTSEEGNKLARVAKVMRFALEIYGDIEKARTFLMKPHIMLGNRIPLEIVLATGPGADSVINILGRAAYGGGV
ncbi:antitoxin (plasmid) [Sphingorhabdus sp. YGSMI21]|nr:antitoxin [Sphingorhabdus sp. YGSMI21]